MATGTRLFRLLMGGTILSLGSLVVPGALMAQGTVGQPGTTGMPLPPAEQTQADDEATEVPGPDVGEEGAGDRQPDVSIPGGGNEIVVTGRRIRDITRSSSQVISVLSTEQIARTGEGDIAGALGRVTGLSIQGNGFVFVRGLGDRYSLALLNGLALPSPEPLSRVVPLDIFPTNIVASSLVQKTYSANFPGEFGGGVINLTTRAVPDEPFLRIGAGISGDTETTFQNGLAYYGSDFDWFGFDDGTRKVPPALQAFFDSGERLSDFSRAQQGEIIKQLGNPNLVLLQKIDHLPANWSASISGGTSTDFGDSGRLGVIATASISNRWRNRFITAQTAINSDLELDTDFRDIVTDNRILVNGLLGLGLELGQSRLRWTNLYIRDVVKQSSLSQGEDFQTGFSEQAARTGWFERQLINTQGVAELRFGPLSVDLRGGYAQTDREAPYEYLFEYVRSNNAADPLGNTFINVLDRQRGTAAVVFSDLTEKLYTGGVDLSYALKDRIRVTGGYAYTLTDRYSERREFLINAPTSFDRAAGALRPDLLLGDALVDFYEFNLVETTQADPAFTAELEIHAGYAQASLSPFDGLTVDVGVRYEDARQEVNPVILNNAPVNEASGTLLRNDYFLPALTVTYVPADGVQLRAAASRTIARPQFRELIFQTYYDPETNRQFNGNPFLKDSTLTNAEVRAEYYFGRGNRASVAGFFKDIRRPIEAYSSFSDNDQLTSFANAPSARLYGAEVDLQYGHDLTGLGGWFTTKQLIAVANYTFTQSSISVREGDTTNVFPGGTRPASDFFIDRRPLTGQSDHLVNLQLGLEDTERLQQVTLLLSYASKRVTSRGTSGLPDIEEDPGLRVDLVAREAVNFLGLPLELKFEARNIFGRGNFEYQTNGVQRIEVNSYEVGRSISLSAAYDF
ncbi:TonB-dependent receptor [Erythrobacteraceae bacterium CFH 75059]|uniref:TonB-dependent receptor domain-containing protein n=1 Tax=Qipengyuania thermophila TaxID=2509361 RepID=UPI00102068B2|nr:TonB-dependent receptor [Qipengyuania thermophila]TCD02064.1 TonB-dependent receptor [Erythrobacteraceae bacterium CFH 75059]